MKTALKLAVLLSILLLGSGSALALPCGGNIVSDICYEVTATDMDNPATESFPVQVFLCEDGTGLVYTPETSGFIPLFWWPSRSAWDSHIQVIVNDAPDDCVGYIEFRGKHEDHFNGIGGCEGDRWKLTGTTTTCLP